MLLRRSWMTRRFEANSVSAESARGSDLEPRLPRDATGGGVDPRWEERRRLRGETDRELCPPEPLGEEEQRLPVAACERAEERPLSVRGTPVSAASPPTPFSSSSSSL